MSIGKNASSQTEIIALQAPKFNCITEEHTLLSHLTYIAKNCYTKRMDQMKIDYIQLYKLIFIAYT